MENNGVSNMQKRHWLITAFSFFCAALYILGSSKNVQAAQSDTEQVENAIASGTTGEVSWLLNKNGTLTLYPSDGISGTMDDFSSKDSIPWYDYRTQIESVKIEKGVKSGSSCKYLFSDCNHLIQADVKELDTSNVKDMGYMFNGCSLLKSLDVSTWDTGNVTGMYNMFHNCSKLTTLDIGSWNTGKVTSMKYMFHNCSSLKNLDIGGWDISHVAGMYNMFQGCSKLISLDIGSWDTGKATNMGSMFYGCSSLENLNIGAWNTANVTDMSYMFEKCSNLTDLDIGEWNTGKVTSMKYMFSNCGKLTTLDVGNWNVNRLTNAYRMFSDCNGLVSLDMGNWNTDKVTTADYMFTGCSKLTTIRLSEKIKSDIINALPTQAWRHIRALDGTKLYDEKLYTADELSKLSGIEMSGTWKNPYSSSSIKNPDGAYEYVTDDDLWTMNGNAWTYTFDVFDDSVPFYFWEENLSGFSSPLMLKTDGSLLNVGSTGTSKTGTVTNKQNVDSGSLKVSKTVVGGDTETKFKFQIMLTGEHIKDSCEYSDVLFTKDIGTIILKDGESKTIEGIPAGTTYSVEEAQTGLYQSSSTNATGTIEQDQTKEVSFTNQEIKDNPPDENTEVNVTVSKKVLPEKNKETGKYQMSATFTGLKANTFYGLSDGTEFTSDSNGNGYVEFNLAQDEELVFLHLPVGCTYQFTEAAGDYTSSYEVTDDQNAGTIAKNEGKNTEEKQELSTGKETAEAGENVKVTFTNEIQYLQNLTLTKKTVKSNGSDYDSKESFNFTITFSNLKPGESFASTVGKVKADEDGTAEKTITLKNGEKAEFYKIPYGTQYQITEEKNSYKPSYSIDAETVVKKTDTGKAEEELSTETESIDMGENDVVAFTNEVSEWYTLPEAGSHALELLAGATMIVLALGYVKRKKSLHNVNNPA